MVKMYKVEPEAQDKKVYNSVQRIQELMWLETGHIDRGELVRQASIKKEEKSNNADP